MINCLFRPKTLVTIQNSGEREQLMRFLTPGWNRPLAAIFAIALITASAGVFAHQGATGIVKERMDLMKAVGASMKTLGSVFKGETSYDPALVAREAQAIAALSGAKMATLFPDGSLDKPSEALPAIWQDWAQFERLTVELQTHAADLAGAAQAAGGSDQPDTESKLLFGKLAKNCSQCHELYRMKKH